MGKWTSQNLSIGADIKGGIYFSYSTINSIHNNHIIFVHKQKNHSSKLNNRFK